MAWAWKPPALARASASGSPSTRPAASAASFKAAMRGPLPPLSIRTNGRSGSTGLTEGVFVCVARKRRIGQRGNQTETMRDMIVLHHPFACASVAAALQHQPPACARDQAEAIARGGKRSDAPARRCGARLQNFRGAEQEKRQARIGGGVLQSLT